MVSVALTDYMDEYFNSLLDERMKDVNLAMTLQ